MVKMTSGAETPEFIQDKLPDEKAAIEREICAGAVRAMRFKGWQTWPLKGDPRQLAEGDFDFAFASDGEQEYLDLVELAPLKGVKGGYEGVPTTLSRGSLVNAIMRLVEKKGLHYLGRRRPKIHLLVYITDFRFLASDGVVALLKVALARNHHGFVSVSYFAPIGGESGQLHVLYPSPDGVPYLTHADEVRLREGMVTNFDPRAWRVDPETGGFFQELPKG